MMCNCKNQTKTEKPKIYSCIKSKIPNRSKPIRDCFRDPAGARTQDPNIKSVVRYLLSYRVIAIFAAAKVLLFSLSWLFSRNFFSFIKPALALTDDNNLIVSAIHNGTLFVLTCTTIDDDVHQILVTVVDFLRVGEVRVDLVFLV